MCPLQQTQSPKDHGAPPRHSLAAVRRRRERLFSRLLRGSLNSGVACHCQWKATAVAADERRCDGLQVARVVAYLKRAGSEDLKMVQPPGDLKDMASRGNARMMAALRAAIHHFTSELCYKVLLSNTFMSTALLDPRSPPIPAQTLPIPERSKTDLQGGIDARLQVESPERLPYLVRARYVAPFRHRYRIR